MIYDYRFIDLSKKKIYLFIKCFLLFLLVSSLFIIQIIFVEKDYLLRIGTVEFNFETKKYLINHLLRGFLKLEFLIIFFLNILLFILTLIANTNIISLLAYIHDFWILII